MLAKTRKGWVAKIRGKPWSCSPGLRRPLAFDPFLPLHARQLARRFPMRAAAPNALLTFLPIAYPLTLDHGPRAVLVTSKTARIRRAASIYILKIIHSPGLAIAASRQEKLAGPLALCI